MTPEEKRAEYIAGLRMLADALANNPDLRLPYEGNTDAMLVFLHGDQRAELAAWARAIPGKVEKDAKGASFELTGAFRGFKIKVMASRNDVCERVVTGTEVVTKTVPDPAADVPMVEVTETVELVKWICPPSLLAGTE